MDSTNPIPLVPTETGAPVVGWPYEVSDEGRVRRTTAARGTPAGRVLRPLRCKNGYAYVGLYADGREWRGTIHSLVATAFLGPRPYRMVVNHKDGDRLNNRAANLEYITYRANAAHAVRTGLQPVGERHPHAKLRAVDVAAIRACIATGKSYGDIARFFNVQAEAVGKIGRGERWHA